MLKNVMNAMLVGAALTATVVVLSVGETASAAPAAATTDSGAADKAKSYTEATLVPFFNGCAELKAELKAANTARKDWGAYSEDWKKFTPEEAAKNTNSYVYGEYLWSGKKDAAFRQQHTKSPSSAVLSAFQSKSNGVIAECFVTDAKGGNVTQTATTSDWFQGDEDKFTKVEKKKECFYPAPKRDDTVGQTGVQVSVPIWDGEEFLGVAVVLVITDKVPAVASAEQK
jgi:hypothetical protein